MFHVVHLIQGFFWQYKKGLLNFVSKRIKLVYMINNTCLAFQISITTSYKPHTPELNCISKFQLLFHWKNLENIWSFTLSLEAGETKLKNHEMRAFFLWGTCAWIQQDAKTSFAVRNLTTRNSLQWDFRTAEQQLLSVRWNLSIYTYKPKWCREVFKTKGA